MSRNLCSTPTGLAPAESKRTFLSLDRPVLPQPLQGWDSRSIATQGSRRRQPWAGRRNPFGVAPSTQHSTLSTQHSALSTQHSALSTQHSALGTQHSELSTQHSAPGTQHPALLSRLVEYFSLDESFNVWRMQAPPGTLKRRVTNEPTNDSDCGSAGCAGNRLVSLPSRAALRQRQSQ